MIRSLRPLLIVCDALRPVAGSRQRLDDVDETTWQAVMALANRHFVTPALYASLADAGRLEELPADVRDYLALLYHGNDLRNQRVRAQALELLRALAGAGVDALLLKGGATLFIESGARRAGRMVRDIDVLVPQKASREVFDVLKRLGYEAIVRYPDGHHAYGDFARTGEPAAVDLHFELLDTPHVLPAREVWRRAAEMTVGEARFFVPSATDRALHNVLHAQIQYLADYYRGSIELRQLHEFAQLAIRHPRGIDWELLAAHIDGHSLQGPLHAYAWTAHRLLGAPWMLRRRPGFGARLHLRRCLLQLRLPLLERLAIPWANLQSAFAPHRMNGIYDAGRPLLLRRLRHAAQFARKRNAGDWMARLLRSPAHPRGWRR